VEDMPSMPRHLMTEAGIGYRFVRQAADSGGAL